MSAASEAQEAFDRIADGSVFERCDHLCGRPKNRFEAQADTAKSPARPERFSGLAIRQAAMAK